MRLIDADLFEVFTYTHRNNDFDDGVQYVLEAIDNAPTIELVNVTIDEDLLARAIEHRRKSEARKKGKWLELDFTEAGEYKCDQCGRLSDFEENFCPNCGADMRGEQP